jgi:hypothetical protein
VILDDAGRDDDGLGRESVVGRGGVACRELVVRCVATYLTHSTVRKL